MPQISVIVPVYKVEPYLHRCVDSILGQTFTDFELILVDDGSPDNCPAICDEYAGKDSRVHVIHQKNSGVSAARNAGLDYCFEKSESRYLAFIDSDDYVKPSYLEKLYFSLIENNTEISACGEFYFSDQPEENTMSNFADCTVYDRTAACRFIYTGASGHASYVVVWGKLFKIELFHGIRFPVGRIHEDQFTTYKVLYSAGRIVEVGECLYGYFTNQNGITHSTFSLKRYDDIDALDEAISFFQSNNEEMLTEAAGQRRKMLIAKYSVMARKARIYADVSPKYKMSILKADRVLTQIYGTDYSEYFMVQYYPNYVRFCAIIRKIKRLVKKEQ